ncbi:hypothetical protein SAMD00019534_031000, partial [Acytostelium subglobosum LB1]|uniref:hypothetical protein n=1 Tax=Acytostelium subglobosum LB1 TaxID=1410327 RepID=UPI000644B9FE
VEYHGDRVAIRTNNGKYISIDGEKVYVSPEFHQEHSLFNIEKHGHNVCIRGIHDNYLGLDTDGRVRAHHHVTDHEMFEEHVV